MVQITGDGTVTPNPADVWNKDVVWNFTGDAIDPNDKLCISEEILLNSSPTSTAQVTDWHERIVDIAGTSQPFGWTLEGASIGLKVGASMVTAIGPKPPNGPMENRPVTRSTSDWLRKLSRKTKDRK